MNSIFKNSVFSISLGTVLSKLFGFFRQIIIAAAFGVGVVYDAFNYAYIIPGFIIIILGGINGPLHNAIVSILTPIRQKKASFILARVSVKLTILFALISLIIYFKALFFIKLIGPNLNFETQQIAAMQLKILSPCIPLSAFIGLSYGALNSRNKFFISSLSPSFTSLTTILFIGFAWATQNKTTSTSFLYEAQILAIATTLGTFIQFLIQIKQIYKIRLLKFSSIWRGSFVEEKRIFNLIIPASFSSGLGQINVFVDMFFASSFPGAASGLAYGNFLIQAPLGILSNSLILPFLPKISKLIKEQDSKKLQINIHETTVYVFLTTFFLSGFFIAFKDQIIQVIFERGAFNYDASITVKKILIAYAIGIPFYLYRDLLIRIFYALEKIKLPFRLSIIGIGLNIAFDWILIGGPIINSGNIFSFNFGISGIVLASGFVNFIISLLLALNLKIQEKSIVNKMLLKKIILIFIAFVMTTILSIQISNAFQLNSEGFITNSLELMIGFFIFTTLYFLITKIFKVNSFKIKF